ncbi:U6 snRNA-associated protein LSm6 [Metarhizium guizhouense ARSEF 977]|uniref:U6 snRNA-associated protein LSm6 n=1 Tax=Metarhizium guizhouense (strain ARSEF 977) TaxID=1276136 RepID=A0A0B4HDE9_METGA|nr:U6 snRNA-associated protein LSm6 [Metarhizium guizhouense ARSEF 977]
MSSAENGSISQGEGKDPSSFLSDIIGNPVIVKLNSGVVYKGEVLLRRCRNVLSTMHMNAACAASKCEWCT